MLRLNSDKRQFLRECAANIQRMLEASKSENAPILTFTPDKIVVKIKVRNAIHDVIIHLAFIYNRVADTADAAADIDIRDLISELNNDLIQLGVSNLDAIEAIDQINSRLSDEESLHNYANAISVMELLASLEDTATLEELLRAPEWYTEEFKQFIATMEKLFKLEDADAYAQLARLEEKLGENDKCYTAAYNKLKTVKKISILDALYLVPPGLAIINDGDMVQYAGLKRILSQDELEQLDESLTLQEKIILGAVCIGVEFRYTGYDFLQREDIHLIKKSQLVQMPFLRGKVLNGKLKNVLPYLKNISSDMKNDQQKEANPAVKGKEEAKLTNLRAINIIRDAAAKRYHTCIVESPLDVDEQSEDERLLKDMLISENVVRSNGPLHSIKSDLVTYDVHAPQDQDEGLSPKSRRLQQDDIVVPDDVCQPARVNVDVASTDVALPLNQDTSLQRQPTQFSRYQVPHQQFQNDSMQQKYEELCKLLSGDDIRKDDSEKHAWMTQSKMYNHYARDALIPKARSVLNEVIKVYQQRPIIKYFSEKTEQDLISVMQQTITLLNTPMYNDYDGQGADQTFTPAHQTALTEYADTANKLNHSGNNNILAGAMMALVGVAIIVGCAMLIASTFGAGAAIGIPVLVAATFVPHFAAGMSVCTLLGAGLGLFGIKPIMRGASEKKLANAMHNLKPEVRV